ncbi:hypothetical protein LTR95_008924 [Oleoguttula sp. CCFEE 5521]
MSQISAEKRSIIVQYREIDGLKFTEIADRIPGVSADAARKICKRAHERVAKSTDDPNADIDHEALLRAAQVAPRSGRPRTRVAGAKKSPRTPRTPQSGPTPNKRPRKMVAAADEPVTDPALVNGTVITTDPALTALSGAAPQAPMMPRQMLPPLAPLRLYDPRLDQHLLNDIAVIHADCITHDGQLLTFLPPLSHEKIVHSWLGWSAEVEQCTRVIILQTALSEMTGQEVVIGVVSLNMPISETGSHRSEVGRLIVSPHHRRRGIARALMERLEAIARENGRWLVMLDTKAGSTAEQLYPRMGYNRIGTIPSYGFDPHDGSLVDEVFYYKDLR